MYPPLNSLAFLKGKFFPEKKFILTPPPNVTGSFHLGHHFEFHMLYFLQKALKKIGYEVSVLGG